MKSILMIIGVLAFLSRAAAIDVTADYGNIVVKEIPSIVYAQSAHGGPNGLTNNAVYRGLVEELGGVTLHVQSSASIGEWNMLTGMYLQGGKPRQGMTLADFKKFSDDCGGKVKIYPIVSWKVYASSALGGQGKDIAEVIRWLKDSGWPVENWQYWRVGAEPYGSWDAEYIESGTTYGQICKEIYTKMKAVEPNIKCGIAGQISWKKGWSDAALAECADVVDFVDYHFYPHDANYGLDTNAAYGVMGQEPFLRTKLLPQFLDQFARHAGGRRLEILFSEYDFWGMDALDKTPPEGKNGTLANALAWGDFIGYGLKLGIYPAGGYYFAGGGSYGMLLGWEQGEQRLGEGTRPIIYSPKTWAVALWQKHFGPTMVDCSVSGSEEYRPTTGRADFANIDGTNYTVKPVPFVTAYAGLDNPNLRASLILINKHATAAQNLAVTLTGVSINHESDTVVHTLSTNDPKGLLAWQNRYDSPGGGKAQQIDPPIQTITRIGNKFAYTLPPHCMVVLSMPMRVPTSTYIRINQPTTGEFFTTKAKTISLSGKLGGPNPITSVRWKNAGTGHGGEAEFDGSTWKAPDIGLQSGANRITVTIADSTSKSTDASISVTSTAAID